MAQPHKRKKTSGVRGISSSGAFLHWLGMLAMVVGLFAPLATTQAATTPMSPEQALMKAAQQPFDTETADFQRVVLVGDFQQQVGCSDWDTNCGQTQLENINGFWTGVYGVPPGTWNWELVAVDWSGVEYSVSEGQVSVGEGQTGIYAEFNSASRDSNVWATTGIAFATGSFGDVALAQDGDGYVANALNISTPGQVDMQVTVNGESTQTGAEFQEGVSRVTFDATGNITNVEHRGYAEIRVQRMDADGNPLNGSCFVLEGPSQSRGCDSDGSPDGSADGSTTLRFPGGFQPGTYTLRETSAAEGAEPLADQQVDVQQGQSTIEARSEGEPTPESGDLVVLRQDEAGNPVGGACFEIINASGEVIESACDEDGDVADDGRIGLLGVPAGDYTLSESRTPEGYEPAADMQVSVLPNDVTNQPVQSAALATDEAVETEEVSDDVTQEAGGDLIETEEATDEVTEEVTEEPIETEEVTEVATEEPADVTTTGRIVVYREDEAGNPVGGSCFEVIDSNGQIVGDACDEDGLAPDDGSTGIENVPVGDYTMVESRVPEGYEQAPDTRVSVTEGDVIYTVSSAAISATEEPVETEEVTEEATEDLIETEEVTEPATEEATEPATEEATEEPTAVGRIVVYREDEAGNPVGGSCFEVINSEGEVVGANCDEDGITPDDGSTGVNDVPVGDHTMVESRVPEGYEQAPDTPVTVTEGDVIYTVSSPALPATEEATEEATEPTTEEAEEVIGEEETGETGLQSVDGAALQVTYDHDEAQPEACVELETQAAIGGLEVPYACDNGENDLDTALGSIRMESLNPGDYDLVVYEGPAELVQLEAQPVTLQEGQLVPLALESAQPEVTTFTVQTTDASGNPIDGASYILNETGEPVAADDSGNVTFEDVTPGDQTVRMTSAPAGYNLADPDTQTVTVAADGTTTATFQVTQATTSFSVQTTDAAGNPIGGASYILNETGEPVAADDSGNVTFEDVTPGDHTVRMTSAPAGYNLADPDTQTVTVAPDGTTTATFQVTQATTSFTVQTTDASGNPIGGASYILNETGEPVAADDSGNVTFEDVTPGDQTVRMTSAPTGYNLADPDTQTVTVAADGTTTVTFQVTQATTSFTVQTTDASGNPIGGASYILNETGEPVAADDSGNVTFEDVTPGDHTVRMTSAPAGYNLADPDTQTVTVAADGTTTATFQVTEATVDIAVTTVDEQTGESVGGACYTLDGGEVTCDEDSTGQVIFQDEAPGEHTLSMESAPAGFEPVGEQVIPAETTNINIGLQQATGSVEVNVVDGEGTPVDGACVQLNDDTPLCDEGDLGGVFTFTGVTVGEYNVTITQIPEGYEPLPEGEDTQVVNVVANETASATFTLTETPPEVGTIEVSVIDGEGVPVEGACVQLNDDTPLCDEGDLGGVFTFSGVTVGEHNVTITEVPDGYEPMPEGEQTQVVNVVANDTASATFTLTETPPATGNLDVTVRYDDETEVANACVTVTMEEEGITETACDETGDGVVHFQDLLAGTYLVTLDTEQYEGPPIEEVVPVSGTVLAGETGTATLYLTQQPTTGTLEITVQADGSNVADACFTVGGETICDDGSGDTNTTPGVVTITGIDPTDSLDVTMSTVPDGYQQPAGQNVSITAGGTTSIEFNLEPEVLPGSVTVLTTDSNGSVLEGACYQLVQGSTIFGPLCDSEPADGEVLFEDVPAGEYRLEQTRRPASQYESPATRNVTVNAGENTTVEVEMAQRTGQLRITTVDAADTSVVLEGACYVLSGASEFGPYCDADDGNSDGIVRFANVPAGEYELSQTVSTAGYDSAANRTVTINPGGSTQITVANERVEPPAESGTLVVIPLDPDGNAVQGGCYQVFDGNSPVTGRICDNADDQPASITFENLPVGDLTLRETLAPSPDWQIAADISVTIANNETTTVEVPHQLKRGNVVIQAVNSVGLPLQGACFNLTNAGDMDICTDSTGQATVSGLIPGVRELTQVEAPFGYKLNETPREVTVHPGQTTTVRVVFENEPPPNTGTVQVQKFYCPAGEDGARTAFLGGAQGNQELQQTAGCEPGIASFTLEAEDGSTESNAEFSTNEQGRAQLTAVEGIYLLTETDPDMPGNSSARLRVGVGQMTTVIVINYVAPPAPAPVTINVEGYTCAPGFNGSSFVDFQNGCMAESQLTNQITVRAEAEARYKRATGDTGELGKTTFTDLPAGTYTIWAERPHTVPVSYMFCGVDPNNPGLKTVNGTVTAELQSGSEILCRVFQVPPLFDADHGAIQVQKYNCPLIERQRGYDYENECDRATEPVPFEIQQIDPKSGDLVGDPVRVNTNADGIVQFPMLLPGTYKLTEVDGEWCFAQSNSVDANGDVVVRQDKLSEVWVYNCVGTKAPPNTGSGDAAGPAGPDAGISPIEVLPNLIWPAALLAGWMIFRDRKQA